MRLFLIVLDSVGIGWAPDAAEYGDEGANTLGHVCAAVDRLSLPTLQALGLGNIVSLLPTGLVLSHVPAALAPLACWGAMREVSRGKDTTTGHWEIAGLWLREGFYLFPRTDPCFPSDLIRTFEERTGRKAIGLRHASGTAIIAELGKRHLREGAWIVYTSADSVFQIAAHEEKIPLAELYRACEIARELCNPLRVGRVIARPFGGRPGAFRRTENRRDYGLPLPEPTVLDRLRGQGISVITVGKLDDIFNRQGITRAVHVETNRAAELTLKELQQSLDTGFVFANFIDFDMLYGHRRDPAGYARALEDIDRFLAGFLKEMQPEDILILTADHGNDPTFRGTDHTREYVPLLVFRRGLTPRCLGIRQGFYDVAQSIASAFRVNPMPRGVSFF